MAHPYRLKSHETGVARRSKARYQGGRRGHLARHRYDLGYFDLEQKTLQPLDNPFGTRVSPMSGTVRYLCLRAGH